MNFSSPENLLHLTAETLQIGWVFWRQKIHDFDNVHVRIFSIAEVGGNSRLFYTKICLKFDFGLFLKNYFSATWLPCIELKIFDVGLVRICCLSQICSEFVEELVSRFCYVQISSVPNLPTLPCFLKRHFSVVSL